MYQITAAFFIVLLQFLSGESSAMHAISMAGAGVPLPNGHAKGRFGEGLRNIATTVTATFGAVQMSLGAAKSLYSEVKPSDNREPITKSTSGNGPKIDFGGMAQSALGVALMAFGAGLRYKDMDAGLEVLEDAANNHKALFVTEAVAFIKRGDTPHAARAAAKFLGATNEQAKAAERLAAKFRERRLGAMNGLLHWPNNVIRPKVQVRGGAPKETLNVHDVLSINGLGTIGNVHSTHMNGNHHQTRALNDDEATIGSPMDTEIEKYEAEIDLITEGKLEDTEQKADFTTALIAASVAKEYGIEKLISIGMLEKNDLNSW